jgi:Tc toxin complex TcA C-terminal TcB-binding domain/Concanavalin A-like lectin/glucanases superfamily/ABC toxin N-terminal region/Bacterial Ig domain
MNTLRQEENPSQKEPTALNEQPDVDMSIQLAAAADEIDPDARPWIEVLAPWKPECESVDECTYDIPRKDGESGVGLVPARVRAYRAYPAPDGPDLGTVRWETAGQSIPNDGIPRGVNEWEVARTLEFPYALSEPRHEILIWVFNRTGAGRIHRVRYVTYRDVTPPTFEIVAPKNNAQVPLGMLAVNGWAEDRQSGVAAVEWSLDGGPYQAATITPGNRVNWRIEILILATGKHTIAMHFRDRKGNQTADTLITIYAAGAYKPKDDLASLRAYLEDLLLYAKTHVKKSDGSEVTTKDLAELLHQPFEQLTASYYGSPDYSSSEISPGSLPVNELRAAIEVLRKYLAPVSALGNGALCVSQSVPSSVQPGQKASVSITMKNTGTTTWTLAAGYMLGSQNPQDNLIWGIGREPLTQSDAIAPGQIKTFDFQISTPVEPGVYNFQWQMLREAVEWFGGYTPNVVITVAEIGKRLLSSLIGTKEPAQTALSISRTAEDEIDPNARPGIDVLAPWKPECGSVDECTYDIPGKDGESGVGTVAARVRAYRAYPAPDGPDLGTVRWETAGQSIPNDGIPGGVNEWEITRTLEFPYDLNEPRHEILIWVFNRTGAGRIHRVRYVTYRDVTPPSFEIVAPKDNEKVTTNKPVIVRGWVEDRQSGVADVQLFLDGTAYPRDSFVQDPENRYRLNWSVTIPGVAEGTRKLTLRFFDNKGNATRDDQAKLTIIGVPGVPQPSITITEPLNDQEIGGTNEIATIEVSGQITSLEPGNPLALIDAIEWNVDDFEVAVDPIAPPQANVNITKRAIPIPYTVQKEQRKLTVFARTVSGVKGEQSIFPLLYQDKTPPKLEIVSPENDTKVPFGIPLLVKGWAEDRQSGVVTVEWSLDGSPTWQPINPNDIVSDPGDSHRVNWQFNVNLTFGLHTIRVRCMDKKNNATGDEAAAIRVVAIATVTEADYRLAAYQALLIRIGTSYEEIRLIRGAKVSDREALGSRLGIAPDRLDMLLLLPSEITEAKLEEIFGMADSTRDPLVTVPNPPLLLQWRHDYLEKLWRDQDTVEYSESSTPIIDPDQVVKDDMLKAEAGDRAFDLWQARSQWLAQTFDDLKNKREERSEALNRPTWIAGKLGGAVSFSGESDYVQINNAPDLEAGNNDADFSVTFWMNLRQGFTGAWRSIVHKGNTNEERTFALWMQPQDNKIYYRISTESDSNAGDSSKAEIPLNTWTHIAYVKSGRSLQLYIDGKLDSEVSLTGASLSNKGPLYLGKDPWYPGINGSLDDIRIYGFALSVQMVQTVIAGEELENSTRPLARWKCDDLSGTKLSDTWAGSLHGELFNGPKWVIGKFDGAVSFSGVSDYVQIDNAPTLEVGKNDADFTVTFWLNLRQGYTSERRSIVHKGNTDAQRTLAVWMQPNDNHIYYRISTESDSNEGGISSAEIQPNTWTHIAYIKSGRRLQLYIDGEFDSEVSLAGASVSNDGPLYLGKDPWNPGINGSIDDIQIYGSALSEQSLQTVLAGKELEASFARWKCDDAGGTQLSDAWSGSHHGALITNFDSFVSETLGKSLHELDQKQQAGTDIEPELNDLHLTRQAFTRLLRVRELAVLGMVRDIEWDDVYHILVQVKKEQNSQAWTQEEREKEIALTPGLFQISETLPQLPPWRATWRARLNWQDTLQARIDQRQATEDALRATVSAVEEQTLPLLRNALIADLANRREMSISQTADWLVQWLLVDLKSNASQLTTRLIQAIETVQGVLFALRAGQLAPSHPIATWKLTVGEGHFDEEWQWMANYSTWRAAMFVFYFPETVLLPSLREPFDASKPFDPLHQTTHFAALLKELRKYPRLTSEQARIETGTYLNALLADKRLEDSSPNPMPKKLRDAINATRPSPENAPTFLTEQHTDETLGKLRQLCREIVDPYSSNQSIPNYIQEIFYGVPMQLAWQLQKSGEYLAALDWLQTVYAYNLPASKQKIYYGLERETNKAPILSRPDHWLTKEANALNPHTLVANYRDGSNPHTRYTLMNLARCMTEFADSEFTRDTAESLARARALYLTAERVLFSSDLDTPSDIPEEATVLPNPLLELLRLRVEIQLTKMRQGRNIAGMKRQVELPVSLPPGPNDLPMIGAGGQLIIPGARPALRPTPYYFRVLLERSKQLANIAQQIEAAYLAALEKRDAENYNLLKANNDLQLAQMGEELQNRRVQEAQAGVGVARAQLQRARVMSERYSMLSSLGLNQFEQQMISSYQEAIGLISQAGGASSAAALLGGTASALSSAAAAASSFVQEMGASVPNVAAIVLHSAAGTAAMAGAAMQSQAAIYSANAQVAQTNASIFGVWASHEARRLDYETQAAIAEQEIAIGEAQIGAAQAHVGVSEQERKIAQTQITQAQAVADFLAKKFTNAELYEWMSGVLGEVYSYFLQQATAMALLAENQLAFERQDTPPKFIQADYWKVPSDISLVTTTDQKTPDRKGLTGSARLLQDIYTLDQYAFETDKRKLNLSQTFSLARMGPYDFELFRQTGVLPFATPMSLFDQGFPGHYLRLIKRVRVSVIALIPPHQGIRATLTATGISRVVTGGDVFQQVVVRRDPELVALTSPISATGVFELDTQSEMLLPFESMGVDTLWEFQMPRAANPFDFRTIADVLVTIEYTALNSYEYRQQVLKMLDPKLSGERSFSFRNQFADAWYDLHNPEQSATPMAVKFKTWREDFPPNLDDLKIEQVLLFFSRVFDESAGDQPFEMELNKFSFTPKGEKGAIGSSATTIDGVISTRRGNGTGWNGMIGKTPAGEWELVLPNTEDMKKLFKDEKIDDILLVLTYGGRTPAWPA